MNRWFDNLPFVGEKIPGKITLSFLMLLLALVMLIVFNTADRTLCVIAMTFSFMGDVSLNHNRDHSQQSKRDFILGGIAFILAHVSYCIAYFYKIKLNNFEVYNVGVLLALILLSLITIIMLKLRALNTEKSDAKLFSFGLIYLWLTGINYTTIFSYSYSVGSIEALAALGGVLFLASDIIIGLEKFFGMKSNLARELVWWLYPIGQIILIIMA